MSNLAGALKDEIRRVARVEIRKELAASRKATASYKREIAALKRELREQSRVVAAIGKNRGVASSVRNTGPAVRFSPSWVKSHREKLELSAHDYAKLVGVSGLTIYNWEKGKSRPRAKQLEAWANVRDLGKREAWERLEQMA